VKEGIMSNAQAARDQQPPLDPRLQNKLITKFGKTLMRQGFTALPQMVQRYYRHVPGNALYDYDYERDTETKTWAKKPNTQRVVCNVSHMTPTEYALMTAIWSYWWSGNSEPWPSVDHLCEQLDKSDRQVRRYLQRLRDKGFMLSIEQYNTEGKQISNRYDFSPFLRKLVDYLDALEQLQKQAQDISKSVQTDRERVSSLAGRRVSEVAPKTDRSIDSDSPNVDDSDSSGTAANFDKEEVGTSPPTCSHIAHETIRNDETDTTNTNSPTRNSKPSSVPFETGGAVRAGAVITNIMDEKLSKWQALAVAQGVSFVQQDALNSYMKNCPRPERTPIRVEERIDEVSRKFNDVQHLTSNRTQATKLWQYARLHGMDHEYLHDTFGEWVSAAAAVPPFVKNKMAWFFKALRLEVLKALLPYECLASRSKAQLSSAEIDETTSQEQEVLHQDEQETSTSEEESLNQEQDASPVSLSDEQECQEQPTLEPESYQTDDPATGWMTQGSALHWAERLRECVGQESYGYDVVPTCFGRWVFYLYKQGKQGQPEGDRKYYTETSSVKARLRGERVDSITSF